MKRFVTKFLFLSLCILVITIILSLFAYNASPKKRYGLEVFRAIKVANTYIPEAHTLILGDSVANQIFFVAKPSMPKEFAVAVCNQAITTMGSLLLLKQWLALNPQTKEVVYVLLPASLANDGSKMFTFHYFIHPFSEAEWINRLDNDAIVHLENRFGWLIINNKSLRHLIYRNDKLYQFYQSYLIKSPPNIPSSDGLPQISVRQLIEMQKLCKAKGVNFTIKFPPLLNSPPRKFATSVAKQLHEIFPEMQNPFDKIVIIEPSNFKDGVHYTKEYLQNNALYMRELLGFHVQ